MDDYEIRERNIGGVTQWLWPRGDAGLWEGPREDWNVFHRAKIKKWVKTFNVVVQAGGGCGMYPRLLSDMFNVVYTFEPLYENFHCLVVNCTKPNIIKINAALGDTPGLVSMTMLSSANMGVARIVDQEESFIPRITIDSIPYRDCNLLMLDVETSELEALKGAMETIHKFNPVIFAERGNRCVDFLKRIGYEQVDSSAMDAVFMREKPPNP